MLRLSFVSPRCKEGPPRIWDTHGISGNVFVNPGASSSAPYPQELNPWSSSTEEPLHSSTVEKSERRTQDQDQRCQSGQSAKNSVIFSGGDSSKNYGADQQRLQISDLHFDKFPTPATFACWKIRFKTEVCICSQFPTEAMHWTKEVEIVDSVDDLMSSSSIRGIQMPNFEVLDAKIASAPNRIIHNSHFKRRISLEQKQDRFLRGRQIAYLIYEYFRVTKANDSVENYAALFTISLRNDDIQEFDSKWDGILLSTTKIPPDDILEGLYKLRIRESDKLKTVLELYNVEIHQKKAPDYHRLKTMVKRSIEQNLRIKNFEARNGNYEKNAVVKNQGTKQRGQRSLGDCWQWKANGQCSNTAESFCSRMREMRREPEVLEAEAQVGEWLDCHEQPSKMSKKNDDKSAVAMLKKNDWHENAWQPVVNRDKSHERSGRPDINRDTSHEWKRGPTGRRSSSARNLGCVFQDMKPPKSILRKRSDMQKPIQRVKLTKAVARHTKIQDQNPSLRYICPGEPHERGPNVPKFDNRSQEETEWQEQGAREAAWKLAKNVY